MSQTLGYAALDPNSPLAPYSFSRRGGPNDVKIDILYCGVCHSDLHTARNEWNNTLYPSVPGHEIVGRVTAVGSAVSAFKVGDVAGVGCPGRQLPHVLVLWRRAGAVLRERFRRHLQRSGVRRRRKHPRRLLGQHRGGRVRAAHQPHRQPGRGRAAALCRHHHLLAAAPVEGRPGQKVGVVGLGGLGHMAVKIANAMGAKVVLFTTSPDKREDALRLGAAEVVVSKNKEEMAAHVSSFDFILNTVAAPHNLDAFVNLLKRDATMTLVGAPAAPHPSPSVFGLIFKRRRIAGSLIGGIAGTQEMLDFCAEHGIVSDIEMIRMQDINEAYERMLKSDVKYRFVIDMATLKAA